jgi:acyl-homoserine-lactone acylase
MSTRTRVAAFVATALVVALPAAADAPAAKYDVTIRWTAHGVPHVKALDWGSLGYGAAYAIATDGVCVLAREFVNVRGEQSKFFGPDEGRREADIFHKSIITEQAIANAAHGAPKEMRALQAGYIAGYNRYLADHPADKLPKRCRNQPWVRPIDAADLARMNIGVSIRYGLGRAQMSIANAAPPKVEMKAAGRVTPVEPRLVDDDTLLFGSNAVGLGKAATVNGRGMLLGNPHYPWSGSSRFHMLHLTIPGQLDLMGVGLLSTQFVSIGFNNDIAWSHTVSTALRYTLYELSLDPADPLAYRYGKQTRKLTPRKVTIDVRQPDGRVTIEARTVYFSHFGPVLEDAELPWTRERAYAIRDSNIDNNRAIEQYLKLGRAKSVEDILAALQSSQGIAWVNTIAADRHGKALYADLSVVPNVDAELLRNCGTSSVPRWKEAPAVVLRGAPDCEWRIDPRARQAGILPPQQLPSLIRDDYVTNSNDSYWLANPAQPLEGYSPIIGPERTARSLRTRAGLAMVNEVLQAKESNKFDAARLEGLLFNHRNYGAELVLDDVLAICKQEAKQVGQDATVDVTRACDVLAAWDRRQDLASRGAQIWTEFWPLAEKTPNLWRVPFDVKDPVHTPRDINRDDAAVRTGVMQSLARAVKTLDDAHIALDAPWGEIQYAERNGEKIGIPGGPGNTGMFSVMYAKLRPNQGYTPIIAGNSWMQVVTWDDAGKVDAHGILSYSQSEEPDSQYSADQTKLYSQSQWLKLPFAESEIAADPQLRTLQLKSP